jgi:hypothetical protein
MRRRGNVIHDPFFERAVYEKLNIIAAEERVKRRKISLKQLCKAISTRFRLKNEEIGKILMDVDSGKKRWKVGNSKRSNVLFP